jgi:hypothetical protein
LQLKPRRAIVTLFVAGSIILGAPVLGYAQGAAVHTSYALASPSSGIDVRQDGNDNDVAVDDNDNDIVASDNDNSDSGGVDKNGDGIDDVTGAPTTVGN